MPEKSKRKTYNAGADEERHQILDRIKVMLKADLTPDGYASLIALKHWIKERVKRNKAHQGGL